MDEATTVRALKDALPGISAWWSDEEIKRAAAAVATAAREEIAVKIDARWLKVANANDATNDSYLEGSMHAYDIAEQIVKGDLDE